MIIDKILLTLPESGSPFFWGMMLTQNTFAAYVGVNVMPTIFLLRMT